MIEVITDIVGMKDYSDIKLFAEKKFLISKREEKNKDKQN